MLGKRQLIRRGSAKLQNRIHSSWCRQREPTLQTCIQTCGRDGSMQSEEWRRCASKGWFACGLGGQHTNRISVRWKHLDIEFHRNVQRLGRFVFPGRGASAATVCRIVSDIFRGEQAKSHGESAVDLAQINERIE